MTKEEYGRHGGAALGEHLAAQLRGEPWNLNPYVVPVGGSSSIGCWGYLEGFRELQEQSQAQGLGLTDIAVVSWGG